MHLSNKINNYYAAGALDDEELPSWIARYTTWLNNRAQREFKLFKMKRAVQQEKKEASLTKKRQETAEQAANDAMQVEETDAIKALRKKVAQLTTLSHKGGREPTRSTLKNAPPQKKDRFETGGKKGPNTNSKARGQG